MLYFPIRIGSCCLPCLLGKKKNSLFYNSITPCTISPLSPPGRPRGACVSVWGKIWVALSPSSTSEISFLMVEKIHTNTSTKLVHLEQYVFSITVLSLYMFLLIVIPWCLQELWLKELGKLIKINLLQWWCFSQVINFLYYILLSMWFCLFFLGG